MTKDREERQTAIIRELKECNEPLPGNELAVRCNVTRQVVVHDVALLRAAGYPILSTPRGYVLESVKAHRAEVILSVLHSPELTSVELYTMVDYGLRVMNVQIEHPLYGELIGSLHLASRRDVEFFLDQLRSENASLLSTLTGGYHMHKIEYESEDRLQEAITALREKGIVVFD